MICYCVYLSRLVDSLTKLNKKEILLKKYSGELSKTEEKPQNKFQWETLERFSTETVLISFPCTNVRMNKCQPLILFLSSSGQVLEFWGKKQQHSIDKTKFVVQLLKSTSWRKDRHSKMSQQHTCWLL